MFPDIDSHFEESDRIDSAGSWDCSADKVTLLADTQAELELFEDEVVGVPTVYRIATVEDHRPKLDSLCCTAGNRTLLQGSPQQQSVRSGATTFWARVRYRSRPYW